MKIKQHYSLLRILVAVHLMLLSSFAEARITQIRKSLLFAPHHLGDVALLHSEEKGFWVVQNGQEHPVDDFLLDPQLQEISSDALDMFLEDGLISIIPHDTGEFELEACHSEAGKGAYTGIFAASAVRFVAYVVLGYGTFGATGSLDKAVVGESLAEIGETLGLALTHGASKGATAAGGAVEIASGAWPKVAVIGQKAGAGIVALG